MACGRGKPIPVPSVAEARASSYTSELARVAIEEELRKLLELVGQLRKAVGCSEDTELLHWVTLLRADCDLQRVQLGMQREVLSAIASLAAACPTAVPAEALLLLLRYGEPLPSPHA